MDETGRGGSVARARRHKDGGGMKRGKGEVSERRAWAGLPRASQAGVSDRLEVITVYATVVFRLRRYADSADARARWWQWVALGWARIGERGLERGHARNETRGRDTANRQEACIQADV